MLTVNDLAHLGVNPILADKIGLKSYGAITLNGTTEVTVSDTLLAAGDVIQLSVTTVAGTPAGAPYVFSRTNGTGFGVKAAAGDTSVLRYEIYKTTVY